jgi:hypothetical protein
VLLALLLPFDLRYHPLFQHGLIIVTNLSVLLYAVAALAVMTLCHPFMAFVRTLATRTSDPTNYFYRQRVPLALFGALLLSSLISSLLPVEKDAGLTWTLDLLAGGLLWLTIPVWLAHETEAQVRRMGMALVTGAVIAAFVGFGEFLFGSGFEHRLAWFKATPTKMGPDLRLSSTFSHANLAAMCFELALPFAIAGLASALVQSAKRWTSVVAWLMAIDVLLSALLLTYSRGGLIGLLVGSTAMAVATRRNWHLTHLLRRRWWVLGLTVGLGLVIGSFALSSSSVEALRFSSLNDWDWYRATYSSALPATMRAGEHIRVPVTVANLGPLTWSGAGAHPYHVSYHWLDASGRVAVFEGARTNLSADVPPGHRQMVVADVQAPSKAGRYLFVWDVVQENVTWFSLRTAQYKALPVRVMDRSPDNGTQVAIKPPDPADPTTLPTAPPADREHIWRVALQMIEAHPLFGTGPHGFRLNYATFAQPRWTIDAAHSPGHAHNVVLEILADLGLVGGGLFTAWFIAVWWPLFVSVRQGCMLSSWHVALVGAVATMLGHGLVDYTLQSLSLLILFMLLSGLAVTVAGSRRAADG